MHREYTRRFQVVLLIALVSLILGVFVGPAVVAFGVPFVVVVAIGLSWPRSSFGTVALVPVGDGIAFEGDRVELVLTMDYVSTQRSTVEIRNGPAILAVESVSSSSSHIWVTVARFGSYGFAGSRVVRWGPFGLLQDTLDIQAEPGIKVFPIIEDVTPLTRKVAAQFGVGRHRSTTRAVAGLEFIDVRQAGPTDALIDVNWKVSARAGGFWLNQRSSELPLDLIVMLDTFPSPSLERLTKIAANLARAHLHNLDRVGLIIFGGTIGWIPPASGRFQERVIAERLLTIRPYQTDADKRIDLIPPSALPRRAHVVVVTTLDDQRIIDAIKELTFRGHQVVIMGPINAPVRISRSEREGRLRTLIRRQLLEDLSRLDIVLVDTETTNALKPEVELGAP